MEPPSGDTPSAEERRWLHDKYQRLSEHEAQLADYRSSYFAVLNTALVAGLALLLVNLYRSPPLFVAGATLLAGFGLVVTMIWSLLLRRTTAALELWREAVLELERVAPPILVHIPTQLTLESTARTFAVDLARPYDTHRRRFQPENAVSRADMIRPSELWSDVPVILAGVWATVLFGVWAWFVLNVPL
jgi:hypothetical protein